MNLTKRLLLGAGIICLIGYFGTSFILWDLNPGNWTVTNRITCLGAILFVFLVFGGVSGQIDEEKRLQKKYLNNEFQHLENGKVKVIHMDSKTENDDSTIYTISYKRIDDGKVFDEKLSEFIKKTNVS